MTTAQLIKETLALGVDVPILDAGLFKQIIAPTIESEADHASRLLDAEAYSIGFAVAPRVNRATVWLIVLQDGRLWKWALCPPDTLHQYMEQYEWLTNVPQVFLTND